MTSYSASVAVPSHNRIDTDTTSAIEISGWRLSSTSMPISNGAEVDACQAEVGINAPEMLFGNNALVLEWFGPDYTKDKESAGEEAKPLWKYEFRALDALKRVHQGPSQPGDGCVKVGYSEAWLKSRTGPAADSPMPEMVEVKPYDWTYTPVYPGHTTVPEGLDNDGFRPADSENLRHQIPIAELQRPDPILFYAEIPLYEDELHDNGLSILTIRIRVMPGSLFVLSRFTLRVDDVLFRNFDTRIYHSFSGSPLVVRDIRGWEAPYKTLKQLLPNPEDLTPLTDPQWIARMLASLPESMTMDKSGKRGTGWKGLGTRIEVLELNKLADGSLESLVEKVDGLQVNSGI
ncbi:Type 2A phosphatase-associated protein 41 [Ceratobasidium sp. AG-Ba]|nr:Type 2A phosphatase-associated protein 41 [Ceratobasidium sp. AG-Ba]